VRQIDRPGQVSSLSRPRQTLPLRVGSRRRRRRRGEVRVGVGSDRRPVPHGKAPPRRRPQVRRPTTAQRRVLEVVRVGGRRRRRGRVLAPRSGGAVIAAAVVSSAPDLDLDDGRRLLVRQLAGGVVDAARLVTLILGVLFNDSDNNSITDSRLRPTPPMPRSDEVD